jgi:hypothetical protein
MPIPLASSDKLEPNSREAINDEFADHTAELATKLPKSGGTMTGNINMNSNRIENLPAPDASGQPARKAETDALSAKFPVQTADIGAAQVTEAKLASGSVTSSKLGTGAVVPGKIASGAIDAAAIIANNVIQTSHILNGNVTTAKLEYKEYVAILSQAGTDPPAVTVVKNTLSGTPVWVRGSAGMYHATLTDEFTVSKTAVLVTNGNSAAFIGGSRLSIHEVVVRVWNASGALADSLLLSATVIIRVYP